MGLQLQHLGRGTPCVGIISLYPLHLGVEGAPAIFAEVSGHAEPWWLPERV